MDSISLSGLAREHLEQAREAHSGRSGHTVHGGQHHVLRQTLIAMRAGAALDEHESPGEATLQVLQGRVRLVAGGEGQDGATGDLLVIPDARHSLQVEEDSVVLLTVAKRP
ncbi:cupin domain-containing protein [Nocardioides caldifontis]|uniref:cupin domain-containing protein n=1 Tax=Nocardioides caldifontis TaxID=2588938 RepID=UPI0011DF8868|nr:cupin domain-containing protein [Nocardioides caldifontis]